MRKFALFNREKQANLNLFVATPIEKMLITGQQATQSHISSTPPEQNLVVEEKEYYSYTSSIDTNHTDCFLFEETDSEIPVVQLEIEKMEILSSMLDCEDFEPGVSSNSEKYFRECFEENAISALNGLLNIFVSNFRNNSKKTHRIVGLLHIISHMEYDEIYPLGQSMAISALSHKNKLVAEYAIKCFENWGSSDGVAILEAVRFSTSWLQEYAEAVIREINEGG